MPLAVAVGLKDPQLDAGVQLQVTPFAAESLLTVAVIDAVPFGPRLDGAPVSATLIGVVPPPPPPVELLLPELQATSAAIMQTARVVEIVWIYLTVHPRSESACYSFLDSDQAMTAPGPEGTHESCGR